MQSRDVTIPLALWVCAAVCAHFLFGTGGLVVGQMHDDRSALGSLAHAASSLAQRGEPTFEVTLGESDENPKKDEALPPPPEPAKPAPVASTAPEKKAPIEKPASPPQPEK